VAREGSIRGEARSGNLRRAGVLDSRLDKLDDRSNRTVVNEEKRA